MNKQEYLRQKGRMERFDSLNKRLKELEEIAKTVDFAHIPNRRTFETLIASYNKEIRVPYELKHEITDAIAEVVSEHIYKLKQEIEEI